MLIVNFEELENKGISVKHYACYSHNLYKYLVRHNHIPIGSRISSKTGKIAEIFILDDSLSQLLKDWTNNTVEKERYCESKKRNKY